MGTIVGLFVGFVGGFILCSILTLGKQDDIYQSWLEARKSLAEKKGYKKALQTIEELLRHG